MLGFSNFWAFSPFCQFLPRLSPLSLFLFFFVVKNVVNNLTLNRKRIYLGVDVNIRPRFKNP